MQVKIKKKILAMLAAVSLAFTPSAQAQNITKTDPSKANTITVDGKVTNITPDRTVNGGKTAINQFSHFELDSGNIANLHLQKANTLVNFVDAKANINGIVNAVKDNKIGGNLYFLSPNGIAIGASGVINAGQVGLIVPIKNSYDNLLKSDSLSDSTFSQKNIGKIPLNYDGSIMVEGNINAPNGITLAALDIKIEPGAKLLNTSKIDFSNLVNVVDSSGENVSAGLDEDLILTADNNGGVYITSHIENKTNVYYSGKPVTASINIGNGAEIISDSDVTLSSTVNINRSAITSSYIDFKTELDVAGNITAQNINLVSTLVDKYSHTKTITNDSPQKDDSSTLGVFSSQKSSGIFDKLTTASVNELSKKNEATLNIADTAKLEATKNINVNAASKFTAKLNTEVSSKNDADASALNVAYARNYSELNIGGTLKAGGNISIDSTAAFDLSSLVTVNFDKSNNTATSLAFNWAMGENQSKLNISKSADINAGGKLNISSLVKTPVNMEANFLREGSSLGAVALSVYKIDSSSSLNSEGNLTAKGDIDVSSKYSAPTFKVNSKISVSNPVSGMEQTEEEAEKTKEAGSVINDFISGSGSSSSSSSSSGSSDEETSEDSITTNAAIIIANNNAYLNLGKATSEGNVNIKAESVINDPQIGAISIVPVQDGGGSITPILTVSTIENNSLIKLSDDITAKSINVKSNLALDNPRLEQVKKDILEIKPQLEKVYDSVIEDAKNASDEEVNAALDEAKNRLDNYLKKIDGKDGTDPMKALTAETNEIVKDLKEYFLKDENVQAIIKTLETATDASKIASFYADREGVINSTSGTASKFNISGAALINIMNNRSTVEIVDGKTLNATSGNLNIDSNLKNVGLSVSGHIIPKSLDTAATDIVVSVNNVSDINAIKFDGNNSLTGNKISISANNNINHIYLNDGSGKGVNPSYHVAGTVSYAGGDGYAGVDMGSAPIINAKDSFKVAANNNTNIFNMTGGLSYGGGSASVGVGVAINNFDVETIANVGKSDNSGSLNAKNVDIKTTTNGMINSFSVAGGLSTSARACW